MKNLNPLLRKITKSDLGQKFLILLSPFMLLPEGASELGDRVSLFFRQLRAQAIAPFVGTLYMAGALAVLSRALKKKGLNFLNLIDFDSLEIGAGCSFVLCILSYGAIFGQYLAPRFLNFITGSKRFPSYSFSFWSAYYGGMLMFMGTLCWIPVGLISLHLRIFVWLISVAVICLILGFLFKRIRERRTLFTQNLPYPERLHLKIVQTIFAYGFSTLMIVPFLYFFLKG